MDEGVGGIGHYRLVREGGRHGPGIQRAVYLGLRQHASRIPGVRGRFIVVEQWHGASRHLGASLPMSAAPSGNQTDLLGRPIGLTRVHAVDASVLPSIPASTITYSAMANASRIVDQVARLLDGAR